MTDIVSYKTLDTETLKNNILEYKYNPASIQRTILDNLEAITNGVVNVVDPTNPWIFLLEASSVNAAAAITESSINLRKQYSALSRNEEDLYLHMSDKDYINKFYTPATAKFKLMIQYNDLLNKMISVPNTGMKKVTIPRNSQFTVNDTIFSLQYPIDIIKYSNGVFQISYDVSKISPIKNIKSNIIDYVINKDSSGIEWLLFEFEVDQFFVETTYFVAQASESFVKEIILTDKYYHCRVFYQNNISDWIEIKTTFTDQVFDPYTPTAVIKIYNNSVSVYIPQVYLNNNLVQGNIRIDVYQTLGYIYTDLSNYKITSFNTFFKAIDEINDINDYTNAMNEIIYLSFSSDKIMSGSNGISFSDLRNLVINHSIGDQSLPITNAQLSSNEYINGFKVIENVDVITNRIFLAFKSLPTPTDKNLITPANISINTFVARLEDIKNLKGIYNNLNRITIASNNIFKHDNGKIIKLSEEELESINQMNIDKKIAYINNGSFIYNPFYYVLDDTKNELFMRAYHLDSPSVSNLNSINFNTSLNLKVNILSYNIVKTEKGYSLQILTKSDSFYKKLNDSFVQAQLAFIPYEENNYAYVNGVITKEPKTNERIFTFDIETNYDVDDKDHILFTNFKMFNTNYVVDSLLNQKFFIMFTTNSLTYEYKPIIEENNIGKFLLPKNTALITIESININFGYALKQLWTRCRTLLSGDEYDKYNENIPLLYNKDEYEVFEETGSIFKIIEGQLNYNLLHKQGDPVLDGNGLPIYKNKIGDPILDSNGKPVSNKLLMSIRNFDLLFLEAEYLLAEQKVYGDYRKEIANIIASWVYKDLDSINDNLLEQTKIYYHSKKMIGEVSVLIGNNETKTINSKQTFDVEVYVNQTIYYNDKIKKEIEKTISLIIYNELQSNTISVSNMIYNIKNQLSDFIISVKINNLGGINNFESVMLVNSDEKLSLSKNLYVSDSNEIYIKEGVVVKFIEHGSI